MAIGVWWNERSGTILRNADSMLRPRAVSVVIGPVARSTSRTRKYSEELGERSDSLTNQLSLYVRRQKPIVLGFLRVPVLIPNPRHTPVDVGRSGLPQVAQKVGTLASCVCIAL